MIDNKFSTKFSEQTEVNIDFFKKYINSFNSKLNFTDTEISLLAEILYYNYNTNPTSSIVELNSKARRVISKNLGITVYNFNNVFQRLKNKKIFLPTDKSKFYQINVPVFKITPKSGDEYFITYCFNII